MGFWSLAFGFRVWGLGFRGLGCIAKMIVTSVVTLTTTTAFDLYSRAVIASSNKLASSFLCSFLHFPTTMGY